MKSYITDKPLKTISLEGCESIGRGAHGEVFRIAPDTAVKVYYPDITMDRIERELNYAKKAFVKGVPTAISFDIVRVGDRYGAVFELLDGESVRDYIHDDDEKTKEFIDKSIALIKKVHSIRMEPGDLPSMKENTLIWLSDIKEDMEPDIYKKVYEYVSGIPDSLNLLHGDVNPGNFLMTGGELMLIDMDTLCTGDPIFELATLYVTYKQFPKINEMAVRIFGLTSEKSAKMWDGMIRLYTGYTDEAELSEVESKAQLLGCIRVIDYMRRHSELEDQQEAIRICMEDIEKIACE